MSTDVVDTVEHIVYDSDNEERPPWKFGDCAISRSGAVFLSQLVAIFCTIAFCIVQLSQQKSCEENTVYITLLSSCITYLLPPPAKS